MNYIIRHINGTFDSLDAFKSTQLWTIINETEGPLDITTEALHNPKTNTIAVSIANSDMANLKTHNGGLDETVRQKVNAAGLRNRNVANVDTKTNDTDYNTWKTDFTSA